MSKNDLFAIGHLQALATSIICSVIGPFFHLLFSFFLFYAYMQTVGLWQTLGVFTLQDFTWLNAPFFLSFLICLAALSNGDFWVSPPEFIQGDFHLLSHFSDCILTPFPPVCYWPFLRVEVSSRCGSRCFAYMGAVLYSTDCLFNISSHQSTISF